MKKPIILITGRGEEAAPAAYAQAVRDAGGVPLVLLPEPKDAAAAVAAADGLLLPGGGDLDPALYHRKPHPKAGAPDRQRDLTEIAALREARRRRLPVLGICRGLQLANVALGGTLHQHLEGHRGEALRHRIRIAPKSLLAGLLGGPGALVNSTHHQAAEAIGKGLCAVAWAEDGVVEALESRDGRLLAVQSHPERLYGEKPVFLRVFRWLVAQAKKG